MSMLPAGAARGLLAGALSLLSLCASAQTWQPMREVVFDSAVFSSTGTAADRVLLEQIWAVDLVRPRSAAGGRKLPAFTLIADVTASGQRYVLSFFTAAGSTRCLPAENGHTATNIYQICTLRVTTTQGSRDLSGYCMLFGDDPAQPRAKNHVEYALVGREVRFRAIQYGRVVPACSRTLRLG